MTERTLPSIGVGIPARPHAGDLAGGHGGPLARPAHGAVARPAVAARPAVVPRPAVARKEAILTTPARAGMLLGATAAVYAVTLAGISGLQAGSEAAVAAANAPHLEDLAAARAANDALATRIGEADVEVRALIASYGQVGTAVTEFEDRLDALAALVADVQGAAAALPARIKLPSVSSVRVSRSGGGGSAPATGGRTGASGG